MYYVHMCVCTQVCMYACMYVYMYGCMDGCEHGHIPQVILTKSETQVLTKAAVLWEQPT